MADVLRAVARRGADGLARVRGQLLPPRALLAQTSSPSPSEFAAAGLVVLDCCRLGGLRPTDSMLDIGSGVGRVAIPLTRYLSPNGLYTGVDMWRDGVDWCAKTITPRFPNFTFRHLDLYHRQFNPTGSSPIDQTRLPFEEAAFDFAMLGAINHLSAPELLALVAEAGRVLRPGGTYVGTCFLVDEQSAALVPQAAAAVACDQPALGRALAAGALELLDLHPGSWRAGPASSTRQSLTFQDVVMARKVSS